MRYLIALLLITNLTFSQEWLKTELTELTESASIKFPNTPERSSLMGVTYYTTTDKMGEYLVMIKDLGEPRIEQSEIHEFYHSAVKGSIETAKGELIEVTEFELDGIKGMEAFYAINTDPPYVRNKRFLVVENTVISYEFSSYKDKAELASISKDTFLNSLAIVAEKEIEAKKESNSNKSSLGLGQLLFYLLIIVLVVGGIIFIRNRKQKKT